MQLLFWDCTHLIQYFLMYFFTQLQMLSVVFECCQYACRAGPCQNVFTNLRGRSLSSPSALALVWLTGFKPTNVARSPTKTQRKLQQMTRKKMIKSVKQCFLWSVMWVKFFLHHSWYTKGFSICPAADQLFQTRQKSASRVLENPFCETQRLNLFISIHLNEF